MFKNKIWNNFIKDKRNKIIIMDEIKLYIISNNENNTSNNKRYINTTDDNNIVESKTIEEIKGDYKIWLTDLIRLMYSCSYRKVISEIEERKDIFKELDIFDLWKFKIIKIRAILRIIKIKLKKYKNEIKRENSYQNKSIKFWFNLTFFEFEELKNEFDPEKNNKIDITSINVIRPIQNIIENYFELFILLIKYYKEKNEIEKICIYLSLVDNFIPYLSYLTDFKSIFLLQKLFLFKSKISLQNNDYLVTLEYQKKVVKLCIRGFLILIDSYKGLDLLYEEIYDKKFLTKKIYNNFVNYLLAYYLRGVTCEQICDLSGAIHSYTLCKIIYLNFLIDDNDLFGYFINKIENNAKSQIGIINDIRKIIKKKRNINNKFKNKRKSSIIKILKNTNRKSLNENKNNNAYKSEYNFINNKKNKRTKLHEDKIYKTVELENYLDNIGKQLYKEEENRNNNLIKKFTKSKYIISTVTMIDNLLSKDFRNILLKMKNVEITKPEEEINNLINRTIIKKRIKLLNSNLSKNKRPNSAINFYKSNYAKDNNIKKNNSINKEINKLKISRNKRNKNFKIIKSNSTIINRNLNKKKSLINNNSSISANYTPKKLFNKRKNLSNSVKVIKYPIDKFNFSKINLNKKNYIDKYYEREMDFHKKLLNCKKSEIKKTSEIDVFNSKKVQESAEREFNLILNLERDKNYNKDICNLLDSKQFKIIKELNRKQSSIKETNEDITFLKIENDILEAKKKKLRRNAIIELNEKKLVWLKNEENMKKLSVECEEINKRKKEIENQRKNLLIRISNLNKK